MRPYRQFNGTDAPMPFCGILKITVLYPAGHPNSLILGCWNIRHFDSRSLRRDEIGAVAELLVDRAEEDDEVHIFLDDMNIDTTDDEEFAILEKARDIVSRLRRDEAWRRPAL